MNFTNARGVYSSLQTLNNFLHYALHSLGCGSKLCTMAKQKQGAINCEGRNCQAGVKCSAK